MMFISSSYMLSRGSVWLIIHLNHSGDISLVEDHDNYSGGLISPEHNETQEQLFIRRAQQRGFLNEEIATFLKESKEKTLKLNSKS